MKRLIGMEMILMVASVLIFRSIWNFLDSIAWFNNGMGHASLLFVGGVTAWIALKNIHAMR